MRLQIVQWSGLVLAIVLSSATARAESDTPDTEHREKTPERKTPRVAVGSGITWLASPGFQPTWGAAFDAAFGVHRQVALVLSAVLPLTSASVFDETSGAVASARTTELGLGFSIPFAPPSSRFVPSVGAGWGMVWMHTSPVVIAGTGALTGREENLFSPSIFANAALTMRVAGPVRVSFGTTLAMTEAQFHVRIDDRDRAQFGQPIFMSQLRAEVAIP